MREFAILPDEAYGVVTENRAQLQRLLAMNIEAEKPRMAPSAIAEMVLSFFSGLCNERNLKSGKTSSTRKIENFLKNGPLSMGDQQGCFSVNSMREFAILPSEAYGADRESSAAGAPSRHEYCFRNCRDGFVLLFWIMH